MQLGHAGAKGSTRVPWEGEDQPLADGNWPLVSASPQQYLDGISDWSRGDDARRHGPRHARLRRARRAAPPRPASTGSSCTARTATCCRRSSRRSPTGAPTSTAARSTNRLRYPLEVFAAIRAVWPQQLPIWVRISAHDWVEGGITPDDAVEIARAVQGRGRRHDRLLVGPGQQEAAAGLRPHVPDAVRRPDPQRSRHRDDRRRRDLRGRPRQQHHRRRPRRPVRDRAPAPRQSGMDAARGREDRLSPTRLAEAVPLGEGAARAQPRAREASTAAQGAGLSALEQANRALGVSK